MTKVQQGLRPERTRLACFSVSAALSAALPPLQSIGCCGFAAQCPPIHLPKKESERQQQKTNKKKMASSLRLAGLGAKMDPPALVIDYTERTTGAGHGCKVEAKQRQEELLVCSSGDS